jgi:hypothetical protein
VKKPISSILAITQAPNFISHPFASGGDQPTR